MNGVVISRVDPTGPAFQALLRRGFVIMEINQAAVATVAEYQRLVAAARPATSWFSTSTSSRYAIVAGRRDETAHGGVPCDSGLTTVHASP